MDPQCWGILECVVNMVPVSHCQLEIISADVTKITQGTAATKVSVFCVNWRIESCSPRFISRLWYEDLSWLVFFFHCFQKLIIVKTSHVRTVEAALMALNRLRVSVLMGGRAISVSKVCWLLLILCSLWRQAREVLLLINPLNNLTGQPVVCMENKVPHCLVHNLLVLFPFWL